MPADRQTTLQNLTPLLPSSLFAGLVGGGLLMLLTSVPVWCRGENACYNHGFFDGIGTFQSLMLGILSLLLAGMLAVALQRENWMKRDPAVLAGGIAGCVAVLVNYLHSQITSVFGHGYAPELSDILSAICFPPANHALPLLAIGLSMVVLAAIGAFTVSLFMERAAGPNGGAAASRLILGSTAAIILVVAVLPPLATHAMLGAGMVDMSPSMAIIMTAVSAERTAPDAIAITVREVPLASVLDPSAPFSIFVNGVDVSNASTCAVSGFAATVDPPEGLSAVKGSQAAWTGTGVLNNATPVDVVVMVHGVDGSEIIVLDLMI